MATDQDHPEPKKTIKPLPKWAEDEHSTISARRTEAGLEISVETKPPPEPAATGNLVVMTDRMAAKLEAEMNAGRRAVAAAEAAQKFRPQPKPDPADGHTQPVHRPGDFSEYRDMKAPHTSKDAGASRRGGFPVAGD